MGGLGKMEFPKDDAWQLKILFLNNMAIEQSTDQFF